MSLQARVWCTARSGPLEVHPGQFTDGRLLQKPLLGQKKQVPDPGTASMAELHGVEGTLSDGWSG